MRVSALTDRFAVDHLPEPAQWPTIVGAPFDDAAHCNISTFLLDQHIAAGHGARTALIEAAVDGCREVSYAELADMVERIAHVLVQHCGLAPGNRVLLRSGNNIMLAASWLAVVRVGGIAVTTLPLLRASELEYMVRSAQVQFAICDQRLADDLQRCHQHNAAAQGPLKKVLYFHPDGSGSLDQLMQQSPAGTPAFPTLAGDPCIIAYTSGTSGTPKATVHFHRDLLAITDAFPVAVLGITPQDRCCGTAPLGFTFGLGGLLCFPLRHGAAAILAEKLTPDSLLQLVQQQRATILFSVPTFYRQMAAIAADYDLPSLRASVSAGECLPAATRQAWKQVCGLDMIDALGATEMLHVVVSCPPSQMREGSIGRALPGYEIAIVDGAMQPLPDGQTGRLAVRGPTGCRYLADVRQAEYVQYGWNLTGDSGWVDSDGYFYYAGRTDDMIISAGYNIAAPEVEDALLRHPAVAECAVVGVPDTARGQLVTAYVVLRPGFQPSTEFAQTLQNFIKQEIAPYKYPRKVEFHAALPRTATGKIQRYQLRRAGTASRLLHKNVLKAIGADPAASGHQYVTRMAELPSAAMRMALASLHPKASTAAQRHAHDTLIYVLRGKGKTFIGDSVVEWEAGDAFHVPAAASHHHVNVLEDEDAFYLACENTPLAGGRQGAQ